MKLPLRTKGSLAFAALTAYVVLVALVLAGERQKLLDLAVGLEQIYMQDGEVAKTEYAIHHALLRLQAALFSESPSPSMADDLALDVELIQSGLQGMQKFSQSFDDELEPLSRRIAGLRASLSRASLVDLEKVLMALESRLSGLDRELDLRRQAQWETYHRVYDRMTLIAVTTVLFGAVVFGALVTMFFSRLAWDIGTLEERAGSVVAGYRGAPLKVTREDEVGGLMEAVNRMQSVLRNHERQLEIVRQQRFHQEKMAAVGSLAAAVAHEINNPIAAIAGIAHSMRDAGRSSDAPSVDFEGAGPELIIEHTQRITAISRQIAEFTRPHSPQAELMDLNRLVRSVCKFTGYDKRLRSVEVGLDLDPEMPAVVCVADHLTQVLMNLLINAGDALADRKDAKPAIRVATRRADAEVVISVTDNGPGMDENVREHAFEEGFSTKAQGQGLGLGLFLCKALVEGEGGRIDLDSAPGRGTSVTIHLPLRRETEA